MTDFDTSIIKPGELYRIRHDGRWEIYLDATMCSTFGICQQMFHHSFVRSITPKGERPFAMNLGSWWSEVMENLYGSFYKEKRLSGDEVIQLALTVWEKLNVSELEKFHPKSYKEFGGKAGAIQMIAEYANTQLPIDYQTWHIVAAEASFGRNREVRIGENDKVILYWMGQPDLYVISGGRLMPVDHKTVAKIDSNTLKKYKPNIQLPGYIIAGRILMGDRITDYPIDRCVINCCARKDMLTKDGEQRARFKRFFISYTEDELNEWARHRLAQASALRHCFEYNEWQWTESLCSNIWNRPCQFQNIEEKPPETREIVIAADYIKKEPWIPGRKTEEEKKDDIA